MLYVHPDEITHAGLKTSQLHNFVITDQNRKNCVQGPFSIKSIK